MSQDGLNEVMRRLAENDGFRQRLLEDPQTALESLDLSATELVALLANDTDGLRRLCGDDVAGYGALLQAPRGGGTTPALAGTQTAYAGLNTPNWQAQLVVTTLPPVFHLPSVQCPV